MKKLDNYLGGKWQQGEGEGQVLYDAVTSAPVAATSTKGLGTCA